MKTTHITTMALCAVFVSGVLISPFVQASTPHNDTTVDPATVAMIDNSEFDREGDFSDEELDGYELNFDTDNMDDDSFVDDVFGELTDAQWTELDKEFDRHSNSIDPLYENYFSADESTKASIKTQMIDEINKHYNTLITFATTQQGKDTLAQEKNDYISSLDEIAERDGEDIEATIEGDVFVDDVFGKLTDTQWAELDKEFDRHFAAVDPLYEDYFTADENTKASIKTQMIDEINKHYSILITFATTQQGKDTLIQEKNDYLSSLDDLDMEWGEDENDHWKEEMFGENADWQKLDAIFEKHGNTIETLFTQLETEVTNKADTTKTKQSLIDAVNTLYNETVSYATEQGKILLTQEKDDFVNFIQNFETMIQEHDFDDMDEDIEFGEGEEGNYAELKDMTEAEYKQLDTLWESHDNAMDALYTQYDEAKDETTKKAIEDKMVAEINNLYTQLKPSITPETVQYLDAEKNEYITFLREDLQGVYDDSHDEEDTQE